jgi:TM2 domain-containing membrane protein YozV
LALEVFRTGQQNGTQIDLFPMSARKNPLIAMVLSVIVPGLGQIYNQEVKKGLAIFGSCLILGLLTYWISGLNKFSTALALLLLWISNVTDAYKVAKTSGQELDFYYRRPYVVAMLLLVGPLALPLLWQSPHFSWTARWIWTAIVLVAALLFIVTPYLMRLLIN